MKVKTAASITNVNVLQSRLGRTSTKEMSDSSKLLYSDNASNVACSSVSSEIENPISVCSVPIVVLSVVSCVKDFLNGLTSCTRRRDTMRFTLIDPGVSAPKLVLHLLEGVHGDSRRGLLQVYRGFDVEYRGDNPVGL